MYCRNLLNNAENNYDEERKHGQIDGELCILSVETDWEGLVRVRFSDYLMHT